MSVLPQQAAEDAAAVPPGRPRHPKRRRRIITTAVVVMVIAAAGGGYYAVEQLHQNTPAPAADPYPVKLVPVVRQSLSEQTSVDGILGYSGSYTVVVPSDSSGPSSGGSSSPSGGSSGGTFTWLPVSGQVVSYIR